MPTVIFECSVVVFPLRVCAYNIKRIQIKLELDAILNLKKKNKPKYRKIMRVICGLEVWTKIKQP